MPFAWLKDDDSPDGSGQGDGKGDGKGDEFRVQSSLDRKKGLLEVVEFVTAERGEDVGQSPDELRPSLLAQRLQKSVMRWRNYQDLGKR